MTITRSLLSLLSLLTLASGCDPTYHARLDDGAGLVEGSAVVVSSVEVGEVRSVRIVEGQVDVELRVDSDHELTLREDSCAVAVQADAGAVLALNMGSGELIDGERPIPQCAPESEQMGQLLESLGQGFGQILRTLTEGLLNGANSGSSSGSTGTTGNPPPTQPTPAPDPAPVQPLPLPTPVPVQAPTNPPPPPGETR